MPRVTKEMLENKIRYYEKLPSANERELELAKEKIKLLHSPMSGPGQLTVQLITIQRLSKALSHIIEEVKKRS